MPCDCLSLSRTLLQSHAVFAPCCCCRWCALSGQNFTQNHAPDSIDFAAVHIWPDLWTVCTLCLQVMLLAAGQLYVNQSVRVHVHVRGRVRVSVSVGRGCGDRVGGRVAGGWVSGCCNSFQLNMRPRNYAYGLLRCGVPGSSQELYMFCTCSRCMCWLCQCCTCCHTLLVMAQLLRCKP